MSHDNNRGHRGCDRMVVGFQLTMQSVPITIYVVSSNLAHGEMYSIQQYVISLSVTYDRSVSGCIPVSPTNKTDRHDIVEILL